LGRWIDTFSTASQGVTPQEHRQNAIAAVSAMVGGMVLARLVDDNPLSEEILAAVRASLPLK